MAVKEFQTMYVGTKGETRREFRFAPELNEWVGEDVSLARRAGWHIHTGGNSIPCEIVNGKTVCADWTFDGLAPIKPGASQVIRRRGRVARAKRSESWQPPAKNVGACMAELIEGFLAIRDNEGCKCKAYAARMDAWGPEGCTARRDEIVEHLVSNQDIIAAAIMAANVPGCSLLSKLTSTRAARPLLKIGANWLLTKAIAQARENVTQRVTKRIDHSRKRRSGTVVVMPVTDLQRRLMRQAHSQAPAPDPFTDTPIIHFGAHLWPVKKYWRRHVDLWNELSNTINGQCIVGVVTDKDSDSFEKVRAALSDRFDVFRMDNTPQGESPTFRELQQRIPSGHNDVLLYCHGKGVRSHTAASEPVQIWTQMMYETVIFNHEKAIQKLNEGYKAFGSFRTFGDMPLTPHNRWHYSGTFFAVRAKYLPGTVVKTGYGGVEAWPGDHIAASDAWCEFNDGPGFKIGYDLEAMYPAIVDAQMQWEVDRIGGPRCEQHKRELDWFISYLHPSDRILVIGSKHGGLEAAIKRQLPGVSTVAIDIAPQADNTQELIVGSSLHHEVQTEAIKRGPYDVVFIDGDHSYEGAASDFEFALTLNPRMIAFHDIADAIKHRREGCEVDKLWVELKSDYLTEEKIVGCGWGGIGIVWA